MQAKIAAFAAVCCLAVAACGAVPRDSGFIGSPPIPSHAWFIPFGGQPTQVIDHGSWQRVDAGSMWGVDAAGNLVRHELTVSALEATVASVPASAWIMGFDQSGNPLLDEGGALMLVQDDGSVRTLWAGTSGSVGGRAVGDALGVWFEVGGGLFGAPGHGLYRWTAAAGAHLVSSSEGNLAGGCS